MSPRFCCQITAPVAVLIAYSLPFHEPTYAVVPTIEAEVAIAPPVAYDHLSFRSDALATLRFGSPVAALRAGSWRKVGQSWYDAATAGEGSEMMGVSATATSTTLVASTPKRRRASALRRRSMGVKERGRRGTSRRHQGVRPCSPHRREVREHGIHSADFVECTKDDLEVGT